MNIKKVLVTGASGYIGRHVVKELLNKGYYVIASDFNYKGVDERAEFSDVKLFSGDKDIYEQLKSSGSYYVEKNLMNADVYLFDSLIETSAAIDRKLLESVGVVLNHGCAIPALHTIWHAGQKYMKLRNYFLSLKFWERSRK